MTPVSEHRISIGNHSLTQVSLSKILSKLIECILFDLQQMSCLPVPVQDNIFPNMSKKMKNCFDSILNLQAGLKNIDLSNVKTVALILGGSPSVPQAIFEVRYPSSIIMKPRSSPESDGISDNKENNNEAAAVQRFFHHFIQSDLCGSLTLPPTKMFVYFEAPRFPPQDWLIPKLGFNLTKKVKTHKRLLITNDAIQKSNQESLPSIPEALKPVTPPPSNFPQLDCCSDGKENESSFVEGYTKDLIWYAAPIVISGYSS